MTSARVVEMFVCLTLFSSSLGFMGTKLPIKNSLQDKNTSGADQGLPSCDGTMSKRTIQKSKTTVKFLLINVVVHRNFRLIIFQPDVNNISCKNVQRPYTALKDFIICSMMQTLD